ncbi:MAG: hypothetical protein OEY14_16735, partial [Myxococcales bacterium]|nr:hypothetical protein [Myxococcales bacterium]
ETPTFGGATEVDALASGESRPSGRAHRPPMPTMDYTRPTIPDAPESHLGLDIDVEIELSKAPSEAPPKVFDAGLHGLLGEVRWQARFSALRHALDEIEIERESPAPAEIAQAMARASHRLEALLDGIAGMEPRQARIEELQERARDFRSTLGRAVDELGRKLSSARGEFESAVGKRNELRAQREATRMLHRQKGQAGEGLETQGPGRPETDRDAMGEADARLWELAAVEAELRTRAVRCDEIEAQLADLRTQLDRENEAIEGELETLVTQAEFELGRLDEVSRSLGEPLAQAESFIRRWWEENPVDRGD